MSVPRPSDPLYGRQWNLQSIQMPAAWAQLPVGRSWGSPVTVAVLDTGYVSSPELNGRVVNGYDFVSNPARSGDGDGRDQDASANGQYAYHGEVIANLIAAAHDGRGMAGLNPQARIVHVRVAGTDGLIEVQDLVDGLKWAAGIPVPGVPANPNPARLLNLSLYADFIPLTRCDPRVQAAVDAVTARGTLVIAGAANDGADAAGYSPAGCRNVLTVTSVTQSGQRPGYANWGRSVALGAPGGEQGQGILASSLSGVNGERSPEGTSFAAPHATGVASLLLMVRPRLTPAQLRDLLTRTVTPYTAGCDSDPARTCGAGLLNASAALRAALASTLGAATPAAGVKTSPAPVRPAPAPIRPPAARPPAGNTSR
ncbi:serine protease [Deinococcus malanensis]|uniref:Serine protease n=2 Tax=Deinococcus malanensis TaxID=1706855 RepID=A0ABQ2F0R8_9DEIO|nr:serine protease [Deinococcus malanensis]